ncbi:MAG: AtpZ/AtpI family protein [Thermodesulfobacteriota bacterium]
MDKEKGHLKKNTNIASIGINLVASIVIGFFIGLYLDKYFSTSPWLMLIFLIFGIAAGFKNLFAQAKKAALFDDDGDDDE